MAIHLSIRYRVHIETIYSAWSIPTTAIFLVLDRVFRKASIRTRWTVHIYYDDRIFFSNLGVLRFYILADDTAL